MVNSESNEMVVLQSFDFYNMEQLAIDLLKALLRFF